MVPTLEPGSGNGKKSKRRRKLHLEGTNTEGTAVEFDNVGKDHTLEQDIVHSAGTTKDLPEANGDKEQQIDKLVASSLLFLSLSFEISFSNLSVPPAFPS